MEATIYNQSGKESGKVSVSEKVFGLPWNADLVHQVVTSMLTDRRTPVAHTKTRADVRGGGKKPWRQKGTGRARHGSTRSPIWVGGGVAHGPRNEKNFTRKVNKKMKIKALYTIISKKFRDGEILFLEEVSFKAPKTKDAVAMLKTLSGVEGFKTLSSKKRNSAYIAVGEKSKALLKSFSNIGSVEVNAVKDMNPADILNYKYLVISNPADSIKYLENKMVKA